MQTRLADWIRDTPDGVEATAILAACVHCGFCTATCPTFQLLGNELDGPRGRIDLIKHMLEGNTVSMTTQRHLDRCLTCRSCETTCPSGVRYGRLAEIGRVHLETLKLRPWFARLFRNLLVAFLQTPAVFNPAVRIARLLSKRWASPGSKSRLPGRKSGGSVPRGAVGHTRKVLLLAGCVQPALLPGVNAATSAVLDVLGIEAIVAPRAGCCGALRLHLGKQEGALDEMRANIDAWWPYVERGIDAIVMTASGCGVTVKEYGNQLRADSLYREKAARVSALTKDLSEWLAPFAQQLAPRAATLARTAIAFQSPCSLQHGQQLRGHIEQTLGALHCDVKIPAAPHLCCGSAGTYSILEPKIAGELRARKVQALELTGAVEIASANVGCICHLQRATALPVRHWIEIVAERIGV